MDVNTLKYVKELISHFEQFLNERKCLDGNCIEDFVSWLNNSVDKNKSTDDHDSMDLTDLLIGTHLVRISNILKIRFNEFVKESNFATFMDFQFLYILHEHGEMTKSELITLNYMKMSSGTEVIKRLVNDSFIKEKLNQKDKRSKLISVTKSGKEQLIAHKDKGIDIYTSFSQSLAPSEKTKVLNFLKLFHTNTEI